MEFVFESARKYILQSIGEDNIYLLDYFGEIALILGCEIPELGILQLNIPSLDSNLDDCNLEWFFKQGHNNANIKEILVTNQ